MNNSTDHSQFGHDIIVIGASAGGVEALLKLVPQLPADLPAAVFVTLHIPAHGTSVLPAILSRNGKLPAVHPAHQQPIQPGHIYIAPPNYHLLLHNGQIHLSRGPHENGHRPAIDPLFRTAARTYGNRVVGVVLSGTLDDGTAGLQAVKQRGGTAIVQDPEEALYPGMPRSAVENVDVDYVLPLAEIGSHLVRLAHEPVPPQVELVSGKMGFEAEIEEMNMDAVDSTDNRPGDPSGFACPSCGGALWELTEGELIRFRCRVGHAYSADTLLSEQVDALESALWTALRALEESAALSERLAARAQQRGHSRGAAQFSEQAQDARQRARLIRAVLMKGEMRETMESGNIEQNGALQDIRQSA